MSRIVFNRKDKKDNENIKNSIYEKFSDVRVLGKLSGDRETTCRSVKYSESYGIDDSTNLPNIVCISSSKTHFLALNEEGLVFSCGKGIAGQLGLGNDKRKSVGLSQIDFERNTFIVDIISSFNQCAAVSRKGKVFIWGSGYSASWKPVMFEIDKHDITQCALGNSHAMILAYSSVETGRPDIGKIFVMGDNQFGQLGIVGDSISSFVPVPKLDKISIVHIACGYYHSIALTEDGSIFFWGTFSTDVDPTLVPTLIPLEQEIVIYCTCNADSALFLTETGKVYTMGYFINENHQKELVTSPIIVPHLANLNVKSIASGITKHMALVEGGKLNSSTVSSKVYIWNDIDMMDDIQSNENVKLYDTITEFENQPILQLGCGERFRIILTDQRNSGYLRKHNFERIQMNLPVRCHICYNFAFGLRHGLWKCSECGLICHSKCKEDSTGGCEPDGSRYTSPTSSDAKKHSKDGKQSEIEEQEAKVMRRWAKAQADFASDFIRHASTTHLREMAGIDPIPSIDSIEINKTPPTTPPVEPVLSNAPPVKTKRSPSITSTTIQPTEYEVGPPVKTRRTRSRTDTVQIQKEEKPKMSSEPIIETSQSYEPTEAETSTNASEEAEKTKRVNSILAKISYYRRKVKELEDELKSITKDDIDVYKGSLSNLTLSPSREETEETKFFHTYSDSSTTAISHEPISEIREKEEPQDMSPTPLSCVIPKSKSRPARPASSRPSERLVLSKSKLSIDKAWTIDPSQVQIEKQLGEGASAIVYLGQYRGQNVAIKVMKDQVGNKRLLDFQFEFHILREMKSKYNVFFYGACLNPNLCLLMEYCERGSLYSCLNDTNQRLKWPRLLKMALEMCKGVSCLHSWEPQIVHRDLKSHNLLIDENWNVKIADFGLARLNTGTMKKNTLSKLRGTYTYCAPEIYYGYPFTAQADVFSIGVILWEMVVRVIKGRYERPYSEFPELEYDFQIIVQTARGKRCTIPPTTPAPLAKLIRACWESEPESRPSSKDLVVSIQNLHRDYRSNQEAWDWAILN